MNTPHLVDEYHREAIALLSELISIPSLSGEEERTATVIEDFLKEKGISCERKGNNIFSRNEQFNPDKPTILLNSHHDTVKPNSGYTLDPFEPIQREGKLFGLGSNDAGGCLVSLISAYLHFYPKSGMPYNVILAATAEEEISGRHGVESILKDIEPIEFGLIGEPTEMKMAVAEKGLMVLDVTAKGISGHTARDTGVNAIYQAIEDINWFKTYQFDKESSYLGPIKMTVSMINSGYQHNVIPDRCEFVVDVRTTDVYSNEEVFEIIKSQINSEVQARSFRLNSSYLPETMAILRVGEQLGIEKFGSPTCSDQAIMSFPTFKMGPGMSERSHTANEFIYLDEIKEGIKGYIKLLETLFNHQKS